MILALDATLVARGPSGEREIAAAGFFQSLFETALQPDELLTEIRVPRPAEPGWGFQKFTKRGIDWAIVGVAVQGRSVGLVNMGPAPLHAEATERALAGGAAPGDAAALAAAGTNPPADNNASSGYRQHLARVLARRALEQAATPVIALRFVRRAMEQAPDSAAKKRSRRGQRGRAGGGPGPRPAQAPGQRAVPGPRGGCGTGHSGDGSGTNPPLHRMLPATGASPGIPIPNPPGAT